MEFLDHVYSPLDPFYFSGNAEREQFAKQFSLETVSVKNLKEKLIVCEFKHCHASFCNITDFEAHYQTAHKNICSICGIVFQSARFRDIHLVESHDSMFAVQCEKSKMFECLVESCGRKFWNSKKRLMHLIEFHKYPDNFVFNPKRKNNNEPKVKAASDPIINEAISSISKDNLLMKLKSQLKN